MFLIKPPQADRLAKQGIDSLRGHMKPVSSFTGGRGVGRGGAGEEGAGQDGLGAAGAGERCTSLCRRGQTLGGGHQSTWVRDLLTQVQ